MDGFKRPVKQPRSIPAVDAEAANDKASEFPTISLEVDKVEKPKPKRWLYVLGTFVTIGLILLVSLMLWYNQQISAVDKADSSTQKVEIKDGAGLGAVASLLAERGLIRNELAFKILAKQRGLQSGIKAGTCSLSSSQSAVEILEKISKGCHDFKAITFFPGATLEPSAYVKRQALAENRPFVDMSVRASLKKAGFSDDEITEAFRASYQSEALKYKPVSASLEGYIIGETFYVDSDASATEVIEAALKHLSEVMLKDDLVKKFQINGLNLHEGLTLASIVGRELDCDGKPNEERKQFCSKYQKQIAEVFYNRMKLGMSLGSDVTSIYAADILGVSPSVDIDSPFNTRLHPGLPPGPIGSVSRLTLSATVDPTKGDELFFLAGDDGLIYFAKDYDEHQRNIINHCSVGCRDL